MIQSFGWADFFHQFSEVCWGTATSVSSLLLSHLAAAMLLSVGPEATIFRGKGGVWRKIHWGQRSGEQQTHFVTEFYSVRLLFYFFFLHSRSNAMLHFTDLYAVSIFDIQFMFGLQTWSGETKMNWNKWKYWVKYVIQVSSGMQRPFFLSHFELQVIVLLFLSILKKNPQKNHCGLAEVFMLFCPSHLQLWCND